jgi:hypothetical protein
MASQRRVIPAFWGRDLRTRVKEEFTLEKTRALLQDQLGGGGLRAYLWKSVFDPRNAVEPLVAPAGTIRCSCVKATGQSSDRRCLSCHGITFIPGYQKFGYETIWFASISSSLTLTNLALNLIVKPNRLELVGSALTGTAETPDIQYIRVDPLGIWEAISNYITRDAVNSSVTTQFSTNGGVTWAPLSSLPQANPQTGRIRFMVTITRTSSSIPSPSWEILRARFSTIPFQGRFGPWILVLKTVPANRNLQELRGITLDASPNNFWTAPLSFFDTCLPDQGGVGGPLDKSLLIIDPAFVQFLDGIPELLAAERWSCTNLSYSDPFGYLTRQFFQARLQQQEEFTGLVF